MSREFLADLPEDLRSNPSLESFQGDDWKTVGPAIFRSFVETKAMTGRKAYDLPKDDWTPDKFKEWNKAIGVPETPDKYPTIDAALAEKAGVDKPVIESALKKFHELGLTPRQAKGLLNDWYLSEAAKGAETSEAQKKAAAEADINALKSEFGDKYDANIGLVKGFLAKYGSPELVEWAEKSGAGNNPAFIKALAKAGQAMLEDTAHGGRAGEFGPVGAKASALQAIKELKMDKAFMDSMFKDGNKEAIKKWNDLYELAYKEG